MDIGNKSCPWWSYILHSDISLTNPEIAFYMDPGCFFLLFFLADLQYKFGLWAVAAQQEPLPPSVRGCSQLSHRPSTNRCLQTCPALPVCAASQHLWVLVGDWRRRKCLWFFETAWKDVTQGMQEGKQGVQMAAVFLFRSYPGLPYSRGIYHK